MPRCIYAADVLLVLLLDCEFFECTMIGWDEPLAAPASTITSSTFSRLGKSNIVFNKIFSRIERNPLAPVFFEIAFSAISRTALSLKLSLAPSRLNNSWYCLIKEFFGSV